MLKMNSNNKYSLNGITIAPAIPSVGEKIKITYNGLLAKSGATEVYAHIGFGDKWAYNNDYKMNKTANAFETTIQISSPKSINICFRDSAFNWDNNSGKNYNFDIV